MTQPALPRDVVPPFDPGRCYARLLHVRGDGFVEFEFAIGDPDLAVELILPADAYREFCRQHNVVHVTPLQAAEIDRRRTRWSAPEEPG